MSFKCVWFQPISTFYLFLSPHNMFHRTRFCRQYDISYHLIYDIISIVKKVKDSLFGIAVTLISTKANQTTLFAISLF